jgi:hypothetical protein
MVVFQESIEEQEGGKVHCVQDVIPIADTCGVLADDPMFAHPAGGVTNKSVEIERHDIVKA